MSGYVKITWEDTETIDGVDYECGHCGCRVGPDKGYVGSTNFKPAYIYICPHCSQPTYLAMDGKKTPNVPYGDPVENLPDDIETLYEETRNTFTVSAFNSAIMVCRKVLMNIAVNQGAPENQSFKKYVDFLVEKGYVPPNGEGWANSIREKGNEANHEIKQMSEADAKELIDFLAMLLKFIYEFPAKHQSKSE